MVLAPVTPGRGPELRALLATMNAAPGIADPGNALVPFGRFERLHFARLAVLDDPTLGDIEAYGVPRPELPVYLAFIGSCDGPADACIAELAERAEPGLRRIFAHCDGFDVDGDLLAWLRAHRRPIAASYVNRVGRTVRQIKQEHAVQRALAARVPRVPPPSGADAQRVRRELIDFVDAEVSAGRLALTPEDPTPVGWWVAEAVHFVAVPLVVLPALVVLAPLWIPVLRVKEERDPEVCPPPDPALLLALQDLEDRDVSNQYTAMGSLKPGWFRRWLVIALLSLIDWSARHVFTRGHLARVQSIHFAFWAFVDDERRVVFTSNYDGGHEAYMDDFINKVAWGLNLSFSHGVGWPRTRWLLARGARLEHRFKDFQRRHQLPTEVWYKAYPGLALSDLERNARIRAGLEQATVSNAQADAWLRLL
jgi:hypothetical protein